MKRKEVVNILKPYWVEYLKNNGEFERKLQLEKFVNSFKELGKLNFYSLLNMDKYIPFKISTYLLRKKFWDFSKTMVKLKETEKKLDAFELKFKDYLTPQDIKEGEERRNSLKNSFEKQLKEYFKSTLGSPDRDTRLWSANEIFNAIKD